MGPQQDEGTQSRGPDNGARPLALRQLHEPLDQTIAQTVARRPNRFNRVAQADSRQAGQARAGWLTGWR